MITCKRSSELISKEADERLSLVERIALGLHLRVCDACRRFRTLVHRMRRVLRHRPDANDEND